MTQEIEKIIHSLCILCAKNGLEFVLQNEGDKNHYLTDLKNKKLILSLPNMDDEHLLSELIDWEKEFKEVL
jgi:hypothetical protein